MSSAFETRIDPTFGPSESAVWWYKEKDQAKGPISEARLCALFADRRVGRATMIWRESFGPEWKRYDQTALWQEPLIHVGVPTPPRVQASAVSASEGITAPEGDDLKHVPSARSGGSFSDKLSQAWNVFSLWGFVFGPLYYCYLRMWRKGAVLLFAYMVADIVGGLFHAASLARVLMACVSAFAVKLDYQRFQADGEKIWPALNFSKNIFTDVLVGAASIFVAAVLVNVPIMGDDEKKLSLTKVPGSGIKQTVILPNYYGPYHAGLWQNQDFVYRSGACNKHKPYFDFSDVRKSFCLNSNSCESFEDSDFGNADVKGNTYNKLSTWNGVPNSMLTTQQRKSFDVVLTTMTLVKRVEVEAALTGRLPETKIFDAIQSAERQTTMVVCH